MAILKKVKSAAKKVASKVGSAVKSAVNTVKSVLNKNAVSYNTASAINAISNKLSGQSQSASGGLDYSPNTASKILSNNTNLVNKVFKSVQSSQNSGGSSSGGPSSGVSYTDLMTIAPRTVSARSNPSSPSFSSDLYATSNLYAGTPVNRTLNASDLASQSVSSSGASRIIQSSPTGGKDYSSDVLNGNVSIGADPTTGLIQSNPVGDVASVEDTEPELTLAEKFLGKLKEAPNEEEFRAKAEKRAGLLQAKQQLQNTQNAINAVTSKMNADILQLRNTAAQEGVVEAVYGGQQAQVTREATIKLLPLQAQLAVDQGNLELAQENTDKLFNVYYNEAKNSVDLWNRQVEAYYEEATAEEKRKYDEKREEKKFSQDLLKDKIDNQRSIAREFLNTGNMSAYRAITSIAPPSNINSPTYIDDLYDYEADLNDVVSRYSASLAKPVGKYTAQQDKAIDSINNSVANSFTYKAVNGAKTFADGVLVSLQQKNGLSDISAINQFQKVIDEGAVTRDQDVKLVQGAQSLVNTLKTKIKKLEKGEVLGDDQRTTMANTVRALYEAKVRALNDDPYLQSQILKAERAGIDIDDTILGQLGTFSSSTEAGNSTQSADVSPELESLRNKYNY